LNEAHLAACSYSSWEIGDEPIRHTASHEVGQIYVPLANWLLAAATLGAVVGFGTSDALAGAYGIAVSLLMAITTLLAALVAIQWGYSPIIVIEVNGFFFVIDCVFFAANSTKFLEGGWFPLLLAGVIAFLMLTWRSGVRLVERARARPGGLHPPAPCRPCCGARRLGRNAPRVIVAGGVEPSALAVGGVVRYLSRCFLRSRLRLPAKALAATPAISETSRNSHRFAGSAIGHTPLLDDSPLAAWKVGRMRGRREP
jgi:K+ potassium transporter